MKKEKELIESMIKIKQVAAEQGIIIKEVSLPSFWLNWRETPPEKLLGINISKAN